MTTTDQITALEGLLARVEVVTASTTSSCRRLCPPMKCKKCGGRTRVTDSRHEASMHARGKLCEPDFVYRCRECRQCGHEWKTVEMHIDRMDDYDIETDRDRLRDRLKGFRKTVLELERMTR